MRRILSTAVALLALGWLVACGTAPSSETAAAEGADGTLPTITHPEPQDGWDGSMLQGELSSTVIEGVAYFVITSESDGQRYGLVLPYGHHAAAEGTSMLAADGSEVARTGGTYVIGGSATDRHLERWQGGPEVYALWNGGNDIQEIWP